MRHLHRLTSTWSGTFAAQIVIQFETLQTLYGVNTRAYQQYFDISQPASGAVGTVFANSYLRLVGFYLDKGLPIIGKTKPSPYFNNTCAPGQDVQSIIFNYLPAGLRLQQGMLELIPRKFSIIY